MHQTDKPTISGSFISCVKFHCLILRGIYFMNLNREISFLYFIARDLFYELESELFMVIHVCVNLKASNNKKCSSSNGNCNKKKL